jgi:type II secretory pathway component GspD/PulD (secretin)
MNRKNNSSPRGQLRLNVVLPILLTTGVLFAWAGDLYPQAGRQIKVLVETQQTGNQNQEAIQGSGSVIIRRGNVQPSGRLSATDRQTTVQRSTGIFTLVQDGGESILTVATRVPSSQIIFYRDYATGAGYVARNIAFNDVGTSLKVSASILPDNQIRVRLTPRISYFSTDRAGAIDFSEATTELVVPNSQPISLGGSTTKMHEVTRQILGYSDRSGTTETSMLLTATIQ